ncbi:MAG: PKD domain-containing protein, partial [Vicingaceae bacterium]
NNPFHIYAQSGSYQVCQTVEDTLNDCLDVFCDTVSIVIPPPCQAGFTHQFQGDSTYFQSIAVNYDSLIYFFGDGDSSTLTNPIHEYSNSGEYIVEQKVFNHRNCISSFKDTIQVTISTSCVAKFELALDTTKPSTLFLINTSSNDNTNQYLWDFGDGNTSSQKNPTHQYAENKPYPICLTVSDTIMNCMSIYCDTVGLDSNGNILKSPGFTLKVLDGTAIGINENKNELNGLMVYPNPAAEFINIKWPLRVSVLNYQLIGNQGQLIKSGRIHKNQGINRIKLYSIDPGLYWLIFTSNENRVIRKIIKQ